MTDVETAAIPLATRLNAACHCIWVDRDTLHGQLRARLGADAAVLDSRAGLVSGHVVFVGSREAAAMDRAIALITRALRSDAWVARIAADTPAIARTHAFAPSGVLGFDFHLGGSTPQLIEINTNPGGLLLSCELARAATASCECLALPVSMLASAGGALDRLDERVVAGFAEEWQRARGAAPLRTIAIVDDDPAQQYLYPEFLLYQRLLEGAGWRVRIADASALTTTADALLLDGEPVDLVYNRLTDFYLADDRHSALRRACEQNLAVITPHPAAHARYADKRQLAWLRDADLLREAGLEQAEQEAVIAAIPATEIVEPAAAADLWARRKSLFFKPVDGYAGKAAYRGDRITRTVFEHVCANRYVAQAIVPTSSRRVSAADGAESDLHVDVRNFAFHDETWLRAARLYRGQTTNFRTEGGGFAPVLALPV